MYLTLSSGMDYRFSCCGDWVFGRGPQEPSLTRGFECKEFIWRKFEEILVDVFVKERRETNKQVTTVLGQLGLFFIPPGDSES